ncbi:MAG: hypothetical protein FJZ88_09655, partial [Chloroflexi bacterium]|nr:hypothetical protein [Chloroflexota bacterium]
MDKLILAGIMAGMVGYLADLFFNPETITADLVFWLFLGLVLAVGRLVGDQQPRKVSSIANVEIAKGGSVLSSKLRDYLSAVIFLLFMILGVIITIKPFLADVYLQKGLNLDARRSPEAVYAFEEAVELQPQEATYWSILGRYHYQMAKRITELNAKREFLAMSISACAKATEQEPYIAFHYHTLADIYGYWAAQGDVEKWPVAFSLYDQSLQLFPNNVFILNKWTLALTASGNMEEARGKLEEAVALDGNWIGNMICGLVLMGKGDERSGEIVSSLAVASDEFPYFIELCRLVAPYRMLPELGRGLEVYIQKAPEHWAPHAMLAATSLFTGDGDRSLQEFSVAMRLVPDKEEGYLVALISELSKVDP